MDSAYQELLYLRGDTIFKAWQLSSNNRMIMRMTTEKIYNITLTPNYGSGLAFQIRKSQRTIPAFVSADQREVTHAITAASVREITAYNLRTILSVIFNIRYSSTFVSLVSAFSQKNKAYKMGLGVCVCLCIILVPP